MQKTGENQESNSNYQKRLDDILSTPLTAENINSYTDKAIDETIILIDDIQAAHKWDILAGTKKEAEDQMLQEELGTNISEVLDRIYEVGEDIRSIDKYIDTSRKNNENKVYIPPDTKAPILAGGENDFSKAYLLPKAKIALFILKNDFEVDLNDPAQFSIKTGTVRPEMMRQTPYDLIEAPELNRTILSCDETRNRTFVFNTKKLEEAEITTDFLLSATKTELDSILENYPKIGQPLNYTKNYADRLKKALTNIEEQNINAEEKPERANYLKNIEYAPEGWYTIEGLAKELGISSSTISVRLSDVAGKEYRDSGGKPRIHYNLEEIKNLPEIQKILDVKIAPEGWYTILGLAKELEISPNAISARLSGVTGKEYRDSGGKPHIHYNLEEIKNLPEIQKLRDMKIAPEGWYTIRGLVKELGISFETVSAKLSDVAGKEYRDSSGKPHIHYNLEEIKNLPEIQKAIEKSKMRKRAQKAIDSSM